MTIFGRIKISIKSKEETEKKVDREQKFLSWGQ